MTRDKDRGYFSQNEQEEHIMDVADKAAETTNERMTHDQVFDSLRRVLSE